MIGCWWNGSCPVHVGFLDYVSFSAKDLPRKVFVLGPIRLLDLELLHV